ncbi:MAG: TM2 domain-containing protein [bacterium]|nr:TM2 domain-containing protein [bacterium]
MGTEMDANERPDKGEDEKFCADCGQLIHKKAEICPKCGVRQMAPPTNLVQTRGRQRIVAALFAFFLGAIGIHQFYLGRVLLGVVYLLLCWTFIPAIIAFIEAILLLIMSDETFDYKFNPQLVALSKRQQGETAT